MGDATDNFSYWEFACRCGSKCEESDGRLVYPPFLKKIQYVRSTTNIRMEVNSGNRCPYWNKKVGGVTDSYHLLRQGCCAGDFKIMDGIDRHAITEVATKIGLSIGFNYQFLHLDDRPKDRRIFLY